MLADTNLKQDGFYSKNVTGLAENQLYFFSVSGFTDAGEGDKTFWTRAKTRQKSVPNIMGPPSVVVISWHTIHVTWTLTDDGLTGIDTFTIFLNSQVITLPVGRLFWRLFRRLLGNKMVDERI